MDDGNGGDNYTYTFVPGSARSISSYALTITAAANTKTYDGTTGAGGADREMSDRLQGSDTADLEARPTATANVGTGLTLTSGGVVNDGNGGDNYTVGTVARRPARS